MRTILLVAPLLLVAAPTLAQTMSARPVAVTTEAARVSARPASWQGATQLFVYAPGGLYQVYAAVGQVADIALQEGETLSDTGAVAAGDTVRWVIGEAASGSGAGRRTHILVKPTDPNIGTKEVARLVCTGPRLG